MVKILVYYNIIKNIKNVDIINFRALLWMTMSTF
jgi:hypothetical protein